MQVAALDSIGRFVSNVGVPAAVLFLVLWQITPRLDATTQSIQNLSTQIAVNTATCSPPRVSVAP